MIAEMSDSDLLARMKNFENHGCTDLNWLTGTDTSRAGSCLITLISIQHETLEGRRSVAAPISLEAASSRIHSLRVSPA
jgi:hypothetical protein